MTQHDLVECCLRRRSKPRRNESCPGAQRAVRGESKKYLQSFERDSKLIRDPWTMMVQGFLHCGS